MMWCVLKMGNVIKWVKTQDCSVVLVEHRKQKGEQDITGKLVVGHDVLPLFWECLDLEDNVETEYSVLT